MKIDKLKEPIRVEEYAIQIHKRLMVLRDRFRTMTPTDAVDYLVGDPEIKWLEYLHSEVLKIPRRYVTDEDLVFLKLKYGS